MMIMEGWKIKKLRDIVTINYGKSPAEIISSEGIYPVVGTGEIGRLGKDFLYDGDSIILGRKGTIDNVYFISGKFWPIDTAYYLSDFYHISPHWLFYFLQTVDLKHMNEATGVPSLSRDFLYTIRVETPPQEEQTKIADILSTIDRAISQTEAIAAKQQRIKTGLMQDLLTKGIDENGNIRKEETHEFKDSPLGRIPVEWQVKSLSDIAKVERGKFTHRPRNDPKFYDGKFPFIQTGDITSRIGRIVNTYTQTLNERGVSVSKEFPRNTIAITIAANIADTAILGISMFFPDSVVGATVFAPNNTRFVELVIRLWKPMLEGLAPQSAQKNINLEVLRPLAIPTPNPEEQQRIGKLYDQFNSVQEQTELMLHKLYSLKTALMKDLLTGKVRVTQLLKNL